MNTSSPLALVGSPGAQGVGPRLVAVPITLREGNAFVRQYHRHHRPVRGFKLGIGAEWAGELIVVVLIGRPVSRVRGEQPIIEVTRLCTDCVQRQIGVNRKGEPTFVNAASFLYARAQKVAAAMGCVIGTYILETEEGVSVRAAGYRFVRKTRGGSWDRNGRPREDKAPTVPKLLFEAAA